MKQGHRKKRKCKCSFCKKDFISNRDAKYCNWECFQKYLSDKNRITRKCFYCKKIITSKKSLNKKTCSKECLSKLKKTMNHSERNGQWKGKKAGIKSIHIWIKHRKPKPKLCENCKKNPPIDLANISQKYNSKTYTRDLKNWEWLCRKCHMKKDGRLKKLWESRKKSVKIAQISA